jgi:hypothetical protein
MANVHCPSPRHRKGFTVSRMVMNCWKVTSSVNSLQHQGTRTMSDMQDVVFSVCCQTVELMAGKLKFQLVVDHAILLRI